MKRASIAVRRRVPAPTKAALKRGLCSIFGTGPFKNALRISKRLPNNAACYYTSEIVQCMLHNSTSFRVFMKYGNSARVEQGHRLGPDYEALVYREVLQSLPLTTTKFYGAYTEPSSRKSWLVLEYIEDAMHVGTSWLQAEGMNAAAEWIGRFHARNQKRAARLSLRLNRYDAKYFRIWARRTVRFERRSGEPWLQQLVVNFEAAIAVLLTAPQTIIHGDFYCDNALYRAGRIYAIDWEFAGIGAGEIDLACLTLGWPDDMSRPWVRSYCAARWPQGAPRAFESRFYAAQLYVLFRLLGEAPGWPNPKERSWRLDLLQAAGERMGLI